MMWRWACMMRRWGLYDEEVELVDARRLGLCDEHGNLYYIDLYMLTCM